MEPNLALLRRLEEFNIDDSESSFPFSAKLAHEQNWTTSFTARAIEEYKRFCYLAVTAGHPVSPSEVVDEVWHLHLTYSYNYWKVFCPEVLQMPFHHHPSKGGGAERAKFDEWSAKTEQSYRVAFSEDPPSAIWQSESQKREVDSNENYQISKALVKNFAQVGALATGVLVLVGCAESAVGNPLEMRGPEFLAFYFWLFVILFAAGWMTRKLLRQPSGGLYEQAPDFSPYAVAFLNGKAVLAVNVAITNLLAKGVLSMDTKKVKVKLVNVTYQPVDEMESAILVAAKSSSEVSIPTIRSRCEPVVSRIRDELVSHGLLMTPKQGLVATLAGFSVAMAAPIHGLMKINVGIDRSRPVLFLVVLCIVSIIACLFLLITPFRTRRGDSFLEAIRAKKNSLRSVGYNRHGANPNDLAFGMALFGVAALSGSSYAAQAKRLQPQTGSSSCGGGGDTSSSTGSAGGDGGGGDGAGSGCGGCGGGD